MLYSNGLFRPRPPARPAPGGGRGLGLGWIAAFIAGYIARDLMDPASPVRKKVRAFFSSGETEKTGESPENTEQNNTRPV